MNDTIEAEVETQALMRREPQQALQPGLFGTSEPVAVIEAASKVASALKSVIAKQKLISSISGKEYPRCEAWTLLGTMIGVFPVLCWTKRLENGWEARVEARTKDGSIVGAAEAECLRSERNWKDRDEFALRSMAQTRATAKALRMPLGFVMTLAGYEATPAEEMTATNTPNEQPAQPPVDALQTFIDALGDNREFAENYCREIAWLMPNETLQQLDKKYLPINSAQWDAFQEGCAKWGETGEGAQPYPPNKPEKPPETKNTASGGKSVVGVIEAVSEKSGGTSDKPWTRYGVKIYGRWMSTFDHEIGKQAKALKGKSVTAHYKETAKGTDLTKIEA